MEGRLTMSIIPGPAVLIAAALLAGAGFSAARAEEKAAPPPAAAAKVTRIVAAVDADGVQRVDVTGGEFYFDPNEIVVRVNTPVELRVRRAGGVVPHNIVVRNPDAGISFAVELKREPVAIRFTPTRPGRYPVYCDKRFLWFRSHRDRGMEGVIEVLPAQ